MEKERERERERETETDKQTDSQIYRWRNGEGGEPDPLLLHSLRSGANSARSAGAMPSIAHDVRRSTASDDFASRAGPRA